jgi:hypothetical protein
VARRPRAGPQLLSPRRRPVDPPVRQCILGSHHHDLPAGGVRPQVSQRHAPGLLPARRSEPRSLRHGRRRGRADPGIGDAWSGNHPVIGAREAPLLRRGMGLDNLAACLRSWTALATTASFDRFEQDRRGPAQGTSGEAPAHPVGFSAPAIRLTARKLRRSVRGRQVVRRHDPSPTLWAEKHPLLGGSDDIAARSDGYRRPRGSVVPLRATIRLDWRSTNERSPLQFVPPDATQAIDGGGDPAENMLPVYSAAWPADLDGPLLPETMMASDAEQGERPVSRDPLAAARLLCRWRTSVMLHSRLSLQPVHARDRRLRPAPLQVSTDAILRLPGWKRLARRGTARASNGPGQVP